ncbi:hypothetical protein AL544_019500 [Vibrio mimicus]|uniref:Uncharacterized protein n=1 Tax=Vibrio mimicus TaxID=674 RepID=A0A2J9V2S6_VIBMI|nr:hypothetical protein AL544_019500 [Vibrio mimicus]
MISAIPLMDDSKPTIFHINTVEIVHAKRGIRVMYSKKIRIIEQMLMQIRALELRLRMIKLL